MKRVNLLRQNPKGTKNKICFRHICIVADFHRVDLKVTNSIFVKYIYLIVIDVVLRGKELFT